MMSTEYVSVSSNRPGTLLLLVTMLLAAASGAAPTLVTAQTPAAATPEATSVASDTAPWWQGAPCYEIFVRSFADSDGDGNGDFTGLRERLDYLNDGDPGTTTDLGVTCLWLMPVMESVSYHGYDVTDYYAVERDYGTREDFAALMDAAHQRGIRVIVDLVINHTSAEHPWFVDAATNANSPYRDWYIFEDANPGYTGPWGDVAWHSSPGGAGFYYGVFWSGMPDLDFRNPAVTAEIQAITGFWLTEMDVDGFRLDAVKHLIENGRVQESTPETIAWLADYAAFIRSVAPDAYTVGEVSGANTRTLAAYYPDTLDQYFHFEFAGNALGVARGGGPLLFRITVRGAEEGIPASRYATFLANHDQPRVATQLAGDERAMRVVAMLLLSTPGTPFIYYGEEIGMSGDKPDELIRTPMQWSAEPGGGFSGGTPWEPLQADWAERNVAAQENDPNSLLSLYRAWVQLRVAHPSLAVGGFTAVDVDDPGVMAFVRESATERTLVVVNTGTEPVAALAMTVPPGGTSGGQAVDLLQPGVTVDIGADGALTLPPLAPGSGTVLLLPAS